MTSQQLVYGKTRVPHDRRRRIVVLLERPSAAAFPREAQGTMGGPCLFPRVQNKRNVQCRLAEGKEIPRSDTKLLEEMVFEYRIEILEE